MPEILAKSLMYSYESRAKYDQYVKEVIERHAQRVSTNDTKEGVEPPKPVSLRFCVDAAWLEAAVFMETFTNRADEPISSVNDITEEILRAFLDEKAKASKDNITIHTLEKYVSKSLRMDMSDECPKSRMANLFISYFVLLKKHGCEWVIESSPKIAVQHVMSKIRPQWLKSRIESDLRLSHQELKRNFHKFKKHCAKLASAMSVLDHYDSRSTKSNGRPVYRSNDESDGDGPDDQVRASSTRGKKKAFKLPPCPHDDCKKQEDENKKRHKISNCPNCKTAADRQALYDKWRAETDTPSARTRSRTSGAAASTNKYSGRLVADEDSPSTHARINDDNASMPVIVRCDDGSDDTLACPTVAEKAVLMGIGKMSAITPIAIKVALVKEGASPEFTFSRLWKIPEIVLELHAGRLALKNVAFLVCDDNLTSEPIIIGRPVLAHPKINTKRY
eukprot:IDg22654t1